VPTGRVHYRHQTPAGGSGQRRSASSTGTKKEGSQTRWGGIRKWPAHKPLNVQGHEGDAYTAAERRGVGWDVHTHPKETPPLFSCWRRKSARGFTSKRHGGWTAKVTLVNTQHRLKPDGKGKAPTRFLPSAYRRGERSAEECTILQKYPTRGKASIQKSAESTSSRISTLLRWHKAVAL